MVSTRSNVHLKGRTSISPPDINILFANVAACRVLQPVKHRCQTKERSIRDGSLREEDKDGSDGYTSVQGGRQDIIVLGPPGEMTATDDILEDEPNNRPGNIIDGSGRWDGTGTREDDGEAIDGNVSLGGDRRIKDTTDLM